LYDNGFVDACLFFPILGLGHEGINQPTSGIQKDTTVMAQLFLDGGATCFKDRDTMASFGAEHLRFFFMGNDMKDDVLM
jgi:hypothetical protein